MTRFERCASQLSHAFEVSGRDVPELPDVATDNNHIETKRLRYEQVWLEKILQRCLICYLNAKRLRERNP
jgi:hypothetical protein